MSNAASAENEHQQETQNGYGWQCISEDSSVNAAFGTDAVRAAFKHI